MQSLGAGLVDSDRLAHEQLCQPDVIARLRGWWGDSIIVDRGGVDRRAIARIVFDDASELERLQDLLYPLIDRRRQELVTKYVSDASIVAIVLDTPKLIEAGLDRQCDVVVFVDADEGRRFKRVSETRGWSRLEMQRREKLLAPLERKRANADHIIVNNSDLKRLRDDVEQLFRCVTASRS